jgi:hypothetical protein
VTTASPGLSFGRRLLVSLLFLSLGLGGAAAGWKLKCEFDFRSSPRASSAGTSDGPPNEPFTLFGLEQLINALGIEPKPSSFHLLSSGEGGSQVATSPDPAQVMADIKRAAERKKAERAPRRNRVAVYFLLLGLPLGACIGLAEGLRRLSLISIVTGLLVGTVVGGAAGFLAGGLQSRAHVALASFTFDNNYKLMIVQLVGWSALAIGIGVATAVASTKAKAFANYITGGLAAGLLVALIYVPSALLIFPYDILEDALPRDKNGSLYWFLFGGAMISLLIGHSSATTTGSANEPVPDTGS